MRILASIVFACTLLVGSGSAQDYQPYPDARITEAQWQSYFQQVKEKFGSSEVHPSANLVEFRSSDTFYVFTEPGHAAHPAWVTQQIVKVSGLGGRLHQEVVDDTLVLVGHIAQLAGERVDNVEVGYGQQLGLAIREPLARCHALTLH